MKMGKSRTLAAKTLHYALVALNEAENGCLNGKKELFPQIEKMCEFDDWDKEVYANGSIRWQVNLSFYSIDAQKAGYIIRKSGDWYITDDGREAVNLEPNALFEKTHLAYRKWKKENTSIAEIEDLPDEDINDNHSEEFLLEEIKSKASDGINEYLHERTPWEFQDMVGALLRTIGYYTPFIAPKGRDGGIDIIAYSDPMGATKPILKVQVKHYAEENVVSVDVVRNIIAVANPDVPVVVTSSRFTESAKIEARLHNVRLIDGSEFVDLWIENYPKMSENDKALMPIEPIFFIKRG